jgi:phenylpropionate dioxygenase-like ring-hydroxylating dioxygenase large terminal subunit
MVYAMVLRAAASRSRCKIKCPAQVRVRAYPVVERQPFVWVWFGDTDLADQAALPLHRGWATKVGVFI